MEIITHVVNMPSGNKNTNNMSIASKSCEECFTIDVNYARTTGSSLRILNKTNNYPEILDQNNSSAIQ